MSSLQLTRLGSRNLAIINTSKLLKRNYTLSNILRAKTDKNEEIEENDKPYSYLKSDAAKWTARETRQPYENKPPYQGIVVSLSVAAFLIYFCMLREENDVDTLFNRDLKSYFPEMTDAEFKKAMSGKAPTP